MDEKKLQTKLQEILKAKGAYVFKVMTANRNGVPDLIACYKGRFIGIEVKGPNGRPSALQLANIGMIREAGGLAGVVYEISQLTNLMNEIDKASN